MAGIDKQAKRADAFGTAADVVCFCFGISREQVLDHIRRPGSSYEQLIAETGIGTKCTACRMNLEILLGDNVHFDHVTAKPAATGRDFRIVNDQFNCAFYFARPEMHTTLRFANPKFPLNADVPLTEYDWRLAVFSAEGEVVHRDRGLLGIGSACVIDFSTIKSIPSFGWFTLDMDPRGDGYIGNIRPQCLLAGRGWAVAYHGQLTMYAGKRRTIMVPTGEGRYDALFPVINTSARDSEIKVEIAGISAEFSDCGSVTIPRYGARLIDLDALLRQPPSGQLSIAAVTSSEPVRRFVMHRHATGSYSVDHFPNTR